MKSSPDPQQPVCPDCGVRRSSPMIPCTYCRTGIDGAIAIINQPKPATARHRESTLDPFWLFLLGIGTLAALIALAQYLAWCFLLLHYTFVVLTLVRVQKLIEYRTKLDQVTRLRELPAIILSSMGAITIITLAAVSSALLTCVGVCMGGLSLMSSARNGQDSWYHEWLAAGLLAGLGVGAYVTFIVGRWLWPGHSHPSAN